MDNLNLIFLFLIPILSGAIGVVLFMKGKINVNLAYPVFFIGFVIALFIYRLIPNTTYGLYEIKNIDIIYAVLFTLIILIGIKIGAKTLKLEKPRVIGQSYFKTILILLFYVASTFMQQFMYQPYIYDSFNYFFTSPHLVFILFSGLMFSMAHLSFRDKLFWQSATALGFSFSIFYAFIPSLLLISIIHSIVGIYAFSHGFINMDGKSRLI